MKLSPITSNQLEKIVKAGVYLAISSILSGVIAMILEDPMVFGVLTPFINILLVTLKQAFTEEQ